MGVVAYYTLIALPIAVRRRSWSLACGSSRYIAYLAASLAKLMASARAGEDRVCGEPAGRVVLARLLVLTATVLSTCFGLSAAAGMDTLFWNSSALPLPHRGAFAYAALLITGLLGMTMAAVNFYGFVILPLAIKWNRWNLAGCHFRLIAYLADGLVMLVERYREDEKELESILAQTVSVSRMGAATDERDPATRQVRSESEAQANTALD